MELIQTSEQATTVSDLDRALSSFASQDYPNPKDRERILELLNTDETNLAERYYYILATRYDLPRADFFAAAFSDLRPTQSLEVLAYLVSGNKAAWDLLHSLTQHFGSDALKTIGIGQYDHGSQGILQAADYLLKKPRLDERTDSEYFHALSELIHNIASLDASLHSIGTYLEQINQEKEGRAMQPELLHTFVASWQKAAMTRIIDILDMRYLERSTGNALPSRIKTITLFTRALRLLYESHPLNQPKDPSGMPYITTPTLVTNENHNYLIDIDHPDVPYQFEIKNFIRPRANSQGEARFNSEIYFRTPNITHPDSDLAELFTHTSESRRRGKTQERTQSSLRIGIDLQQHNEQTEVALDIGRGYYDASFPKRSGDPLGNRLQFLTESGTHTTGIFPEDCADPENFAAFMDLLSEAMDQAMHTLDQTK